MYSKSAQVMPEMARRCDRQSICTACGEGETRSDRRVQLSSLQPGVCKGGAPDLPMTLRTANIAGNQSGVFMASDQSRPSELE